jgi:hypothetical protein
VGDTSRMMDGDPPATGAEVGARQMARLREEMRRREVEGKGGMDDRRVLD